MFNLESNGDTAIFTSANERLRVLFPSPAIVRITATDGKAFQGQASNIVVGAQSSIGFELKETRDEFTLSTAALRIQLDRHTGALTYRNARGELLFGEPEGGGRTLTRKPVHRNIFNRDDAVAFAQSTDGIRAAATNYTTMVDRTAYEARLDFVFSPDEALFGLGSHEEGIGNLRGHSRQLYQQNMKAVVPYFVSTRGYGVLLDCESLMLFHDDEQGSFWWADVVEELDFYVIAGDVFDDITRGYHQLTGPVPMLPRWAFGYMQSKERYVTANEMLDVVREYRRREIPLDTIVLDWKSWPNGAGWGQKSFDPVRFPDPASFIAQLHDMNVRLMVSIWPIMTGGCDNQRELLDQNLMLGNQSTYNAFDPEARALYWKQAQEGLFAHGVDAWWCDCTEPFEADWSGASKPAPEARLALNTGESKFYLDPAHINSYSLLHSRGIYEGQRSASMSKRVVNLTRSSYAGQHRYSTITWSGDVCATWETLRHSIPEGLNFCASGEPWWTVDIGGFFVDHNPELWFWRGDYPGATRGLTAMDALTADPYDTGSTDLGFFELYTRWLQYAVFLPVFRSHGTDVAREIWRFGEEGSLFYDVIAKHIRLRYQLLPYIYSLAAQVTLNSYTLLRAVALDFPQDAGTHNLTDQFLFGPSMLVCPVTHAMYYGANSEALEGINRTRRVYLPSGAAWYNFWTSELHPGNQTIEAEAPLDTIPVFIRAGSILPMSQPLQWTGDKPGAPYEIRVYTGVDASFTLYEDSGDSYDYEDAAFALIRLEWNEALRRLTIHEREGTYPEIVSMRTYNLTFIAKSTSTRYSVTYTGDTLHVQHDLQRHTS